MNQDKLFDRELKRLAFINRQPSMAALTSNGYRTISLIR